MARKGRTSAPREMGKKRWKHGIGEKKQDKGRENERMRSGKQEVEERGEERSEVRDWARLTPKLHSL